MLDELAVANLGLISGARLEPGAGLIALTGETGAGKTLLLGALRLLRGDAARTDRIGPAGDEARVDGRFAIGDDEVTVARRVTPSRSRAYLNGVMSPASALTERLGSIVEIVGQHEHITLSREGAVRDIVDAALDAAGQEARSAYRTAWSTLRGLLTDREAIGGDRRTLERDLDLARHQSREIDAAGLQPREDVELAAVLERLRHATEIAESLAAAHGALGEDGAGDSLGRGLDAVREAAVHDPALADLARRIDAAAAEVADAAAEARGAAEDLEHDPVELERAEQRMAVIGDLRRKYGDTLEEIVAFGEEAAQRAATLEALLERSDTLEGEIEAAEADVAERGAALSEARRRAADRLGASAGAHLGELGFEAPSIRFDFEEREPTANGTDRIKLLFASDAALDPAPVARIASGGELSRLVLAIHLAAGVGEVPVVAFDEIDAGIGGATALTMGRKLADLAAGRQVFVVTHLPQVAAFAETHYVVEREGPVAAVRRVDGEDRLAELTRMLGGLPDSEQGRSHAAELVDLAVEHREG